MPIHADIIQVFSQAEGLIKESFQFAVISSTMSAVEHSSKTCCLIFYRKHMSRSLNNNIANTNILYSTLGILGIAFSPRHLQAARGSREEFGFSFDLCRRAVCLS